MAFIDCITCGYRQTERIPAHFVGKSIKCPQCRRPVTVRISDTLKSIDFPIPDRFEKPSIGDVKSASENRVPTIESQTLPKDRQPLRWDVLLATAVLAGSVGFIVAKYATPQDPNIKKVMAVDPIVARQIPRLNRAADDSHAMLTAYLAENTNTGEWEEVKYWPAFSFSTDSHANAVLSASFRMMQQRYSTDVYGAALKLQTVARNNQDLRFMRMKYRTKNGFGNLELRDEVFALNGQDVLPLSNIEQDLVQWAWEDLQQAEGGVVIPEPKDPSVEAHERMFGPESEDVKDLVRRLNQKPNK
jgi:hypothetical protein